MLIKKRLSRLKISSAGGFTLIELLVVMLIIGLLATLVGPKIFGKVKGAKQKAAKAQIAMFAQALELFRLDVGRYPSTAEGLQALRTNPGGLESWDNGYLSQEVPKDPWSRDYVYISPGNHGDYDIMSYGLDGVEGGDGENKDIVSWKGLN